VVRSRRGDEFVETERWWAGELTMGGADGACASAKKQMGRTYEYEWTGLSKKKTGSGRGI